MQRNIVYIVALALVGLLTASRPACAVVECFIVSSVGVNFGVYDVFTASPTDSTGSITYTCSGGASATTVTIDLSRGNTATAPLRQMRQGAKMLNYNLYLDAARTTIWGDGTAGTAHYGPMHPPQNQNMTVIIYGRIPAKQDVSVGTYADTITATINF